jgi:processive 1,2-diacylglycerol beta-glucosyltransferase
VPQGCPEPIRRVLILSADIGAGHLVAGRALAAELESRGLQVVVVEDLRSSLGTILRLLIHEGSRVLFAHGRRLYDAYYWLLLRCAPFRAISAASLRRCGGRRLTRLIRRHKPDVIVSTYPGVTVVLGQLRRRRRLDVPVLAVITDFAGMFFWAHRGVDQHLLAWAESAAEVERIARSRNSIHVLAPTDPAFHAPVERQVARARCGLPATGRIAVVSGGGWGVGPMHETVRSVIAAGAERVIAVTGENERARASLRERFRGDARVAVLGYTDRMSDLLAAADVLVHATCGVTCLEAALRGCPTVIYGFGVGHVRHNARRMAELGLVSRARNEADLTRIARSIFEAPRVAGGSQRPPLPTAAEVVSTARPCVRPLPRWWLAVRRIAPAGTALALALALSTTGGYALAARVDADLKPVRHVAVSRPEVALVARPPAAGVESLLDRLAADHLAVTVALTEAPNGVVADEARSAGVEIVPALQGGQRLHWFATPDRIEDLRETVGARGHGPYVAPSHGFTLGQYLLGRTAHAYPVQPLREPVGRIHRGDIVQVGNWASIHRVCAALARRGMGVTTLSSLLAGQRGTAEIR